MNLISEIMINILCVICIAMSLIRGEWQEFFLKEQNVSLF